MYGGILAERERIGRPVSELDCMIAAIARVNGAAVATRDLYGFENCGVYVVNPWMD
jgi:predicted nucleic acid-binding protein